MIIDIIVLVVLFFSALISFIRGFIRETLTILGVGGGLAAAYFGGPVLAPTIKNLLGVKEGAQPERLFNLIPYPILGDVLSYGLIFIAVVIVLSIVSHILAESVRAVGLGAIDRALGVMFGLVRGLLLLAVLYLPFHLSLDAETKAKWFEGSKTQPWLSGMAEVLTEYLPDDTVKQIKDTVKKGAGGEEEEKEVIPQIDLLRGSGKCDACNAWNSIAEEIGRTAIPKGLGNKKKGRAIELELLQGQSDKNYPRYVTGIKEFDRVTGGGLVPGSALLIGGDPGIGKSTLLLQVICALAKVPPHKSLPPHPNHPPNRGRESGMRCVYVSGEESIEQVRMRAQRLGLSDAPVELAAAVNVRDILASVEEQEKNNPVTLLIIDSIQTMFIDTVEAAPGTVTQVRTAAQEIIRAAKSRDMAVIFVGHVTKDGQIAGPRVLEHMVDTVLYFEGDRSHHFRILRAVKNRFGPTDEIGVFEMGGEGLLEVENPSALFLSQRHQNVAGSAVLAAMEGTRPLLVEVQALVAPSSLGSPRRAVIGWDPNRLAMIVAVLETRAGVKLSGCDIFLNIAGGIRIAEPAADMAVAAALISAVTGNPLPPESVFFGEIGLAGEIRQVAQPDQRLKEAAKLGFKEAVIPARKKKGAAANDPLRVAEVTHVEDLAELFTVGRTVRSVSAG